MDEWNDKILNGNIDTYLSQFSDIEMDIIKSEKRIELEKETIQFTKNSEHFLQWLMDNDMNFCIVTNTNEKTAELFKSKLPLLKKIKQWIYRDNYTCPKPNPECYHLAKQKYYKNEPYIIGFEDSLVGYTALKSITSLIYIYKNEELFKKKDCYLFDDYMRFSSGNS
jgi:HAD superfamily hydrolase (TIGR01509 family)